MGLLVIHLKPNSVGMSFVLLQKWLFFLYLGHGLGCSSDCPFRVLTNGLGVRYGAQVRTLRKTMVDAPLPYHWHYYYTTSTNSTNNILVVLTISTTSII